MSRHRHVWDGSRICTVCGYMPLAWKHGQYKDRPVYLSSGSWLSAEQARQLRDDLTKVLRKLKQTTVDERQLTIPGT